MGDEHDPTPQGRWRSVTTRHWVATALGLLFAAAILLAGVVGERWACGAEPHADDELDRELAVAAEWRPPAEPDDPDAWMPATVGDFRLEARDLPPESPGLQLALEGPAARYLTRKRAVEVRVTRMDAAGYTATRTHLGQVLDRKGIFARAGLSTDEFKRFAYADNGERGLLWWRHGWLLHFWTDNRADLDAFAAAYRAEVAGEAGTAPPP